MSYTIQWVWDDPCEQLLPCPECSCSRGSAGHSGVMRGSPAAQLPCRAPRLPLETTACLQHVLPCNELILHPHSQHRRPVQTVWTWNHCPLFLPVQDIEEIILPQVHRKLWIKLEMPISHSTLGSACFWVSAVLALQCWSSYPCWSLQCNLHSFYILCKKVRQNMAEKVCQNTLRGHLTFQ